jgi:outer membrane protein OmpA-like peptidoglycan-associated protein
MSRRLRASLLVAASSTLALGILAAGDAGAADVKGYGMNRYEPSERGSQWFSSESLDFDGKVQPAAGLVADWGFKPQQIRQLPSEGGNLVANVENQLALHLGAALTVAGRVQIGFNLPIYAVDSGSAVNRFDGTTYAKPANSFALGDLRLNAQVRLVGEPHDAFRLGIGLQFWAPTGKADNFTGDEKFKIQPHLNVAGDVDIFTYSVRAGFLYRGISGDQRSYVLTPIGNEITWGASAGVKVLDGNLILGPELMGSFAVNNGPAIPDKAFAPGSLLIGGHYRAGDFVVGLAAGPGISHASGTAAFRTLASLEWAPLAAKEAPPPPPEKDSDGDGIVDSKDACPAVPGVANNDPKKNGCPADRDEDGILDKDDACPDVKGVANADPKKNGCPADRDEDGIIDAEDACPDVKGVKDADPKKNGCPPDRDGDGIVDAEDACPDVKGVKSDDPKRNGCPPDRDGDGILDDVDACPDAAGPPNDDPKKNGCPKVAVMNGQIRIFEQVKFKTASAVILKESDEILDMVAKTLKDHPEIKHVRVEGHTDNQGNAGYNKGLSQQRANSVMAALVKRGIDKKRMEAKGWGQEKPIAPNDTEAGRQDNRRVEFHITEDGKPETPTTGATPATKPATPPATKPATPPPAKPATPPPAKPATPPPAKPATPPAKPTTPAPAPTTAPKK